MGAVRLNDENEVVEQVGEGEQLNYFAEQQWKQQVRQVSRWMKARTSKTLVHCALLAQAFNLKGCGETEGELGQREQDQFWMTIAIPIVIGCCNWLYQHWEQVVARFGLRGRKRRRSERDEEEPEPEAVRRVVANENVEPGSSSMAGPMTSTGHVEPRPPLFPPMPIDPPERWAPWSPEWFTYWMLGRVERRVERRAGRMTEQERKKYEKKREILRSVLMVLEQRPGERARRRAHQFCQQMTDLSVDEDSPQAPEVPELPEPGAEPTDAVGGSLSIGEESGYFDQDRVPGRSLEVSSEAAKAMARPDRDEEEENEESEIENSESEDTRVGRYLNGTMSEVSDPEMWMNLHYLSSGSGSDNAEEQPSGSTGH